MPTSLPICTILGASAIALSALAPAQAQSGCSSSASTNSIVSVASSNADFSTLVAAVKAAGLAERLSGGDPVTVFAPTNEAFAKLPKGTVETLLKPENKDRLARILAFHVVPGKVMAAQAVKLTNAPSLSGQRLNLMLKGDALMINGAKVIKTDIDASNGIIHVIDTVILPSEDDLAATASKAGMFNTLLAAAKAAGLVDALKGDGPLTVMAPTDEAFARLPAGTVESLLKPANKEALATVLKTHIISGRIFSDEALKAGEAKTLAGETIRFSMNGGKAMVNSATIVKTDIQATNGVVHVIDSVILPAKMPKLANAAGAAGTHKTASR